MNRKTPLILCGVLSLVAGGTLQRAYGVEHGQLAMGATRRPEVGLLIRANGQSCTATLINPGWALTAAHCIYWSTEHPEEYHFSIGDETNHFMRYDVAGLVNLSARKQTWGDRIPTEEEIAQGGLLGPFHTPTFRGNDDVALVQLAQAVPPEVALPAGVESTYPAVGALATLFGYGDNLCKFTEGDHGSGTKRYGSWNYQFANSPGGNAANSQQVPPSGLICSGDSGGPAFLGAPEAGGAIFAVASLGGTTDTYGDVVHFQPTIAAFVTGNLPSFRKELHHNDEWWDQTVNNLRIGPRPPSWQIGHDYLPGDRVMFYDQMYAAVLPNTGSSETVPDASPDLWVLPKPVADSTRVLPTLSVTQNTYSGTDWWGTMRFINQGPGSSSSYQVAFDVPSGVNCTAEPDAIPSGAVLSPLVGSGSSAHTAANHCVFTWESAPSLNLGVSKTFNYSTNSQSFSAANNVTVIDSTFCKPESDAQFCSRLAKNCGTVTALDNCKFPRTVSACGVCSSPSTCGGGGTPNVCGASCSFSITLNSYDGPDMWGTIRFRNDGPATASHYRVEFDIPSGKHCTNEPESVPAGATLSPLVGSGSSAHTASNHCVFTWTNAPALAAGASKTFNYSTDSSSSSFTAATGVVASDSLCH